MKVHHNSHNVCRNCPSEALIAYLSLRMNRITCCCRITLHYISLFKFPSIITNCAPPPLITHTIKLSPPNVSHRTTCECVQRSCARWHTLARPTLLSKWSRGSSVKRIFTTSCIQNIILHLLNVRETVLWSGIINWRVAGRRSCSNVILTQSIEDGHTTYSTNSRDVAVSITEAISAVDQTNVRVTLCRPQRWWSIMLLDLWKHFQTDPIMFWCSKAFIFAQPWHYAE